MLQIKPLQVVLKITFMYTLAEAAKINTYQQDLFKVFLSLYI